jgi:hypothetical protein
VTSVTPRCGARPGIGRSRCGADGDLTCILAGGKTSTFSVGYFVGSLARGSINRNLALALTRLVPPGLRLREIPIGELPLYSYDYDADYPPPCPSAIRR